MESEKLVSIIIPVYNVEEYLDECVQSVCNQTYHNMEIILVNDGSTDSSGSKCDDWEKRDDRIRVIHKINGGLSSARNSALDIAKGIYIYFCDSDDYIASDLIEKTILHMEKGYDLVAFEYNEIYDNGTVKPCAYHKTGIFEINNEEEKKDFLTRVVLSSKIGWSACTRIYRRDIVEKYNLRFADNRIIFSEDLFFTTCYCAHVKKVLSIDALLYYYRQRENSIMGENTVKLNVNRMNECGKAILKHFSEYKDCKCLVDIFPVIHFMIVNNVINRYQTIMELNMKDLRKDILYDLVDYDFFNQQMRKLKKHRKLLYSIYSRIKTEMLISNTIYILDGKYLPAMLRKIGIGLVAKAAELRKK